MDDIKLQTAFLEELLIDNILSFGKETGVRFEQTVICSVTDMDVKEPMKNTGIHFESFDLRFKTNVSLPNYIGLGKGVDHGFGTITRMNNNEKNKSTK
jgi:hypothetical protein